MTALEELKFNIRESQYPYFSDTELQYFLDKNIISDDGQGNIVYDIEKASYEALLLKAEDDSIKVPGLDFKGTKEYFLRLARKFRPACNGIIRRADEIYE